MSVKAVQRSTGSYRSERGMVRDLSVLVLREESPFGCVEVTMEFDYAAGRTDVVGLGRKDTLHAFETKLVKWRKALDQARRNACFAHYCYVALPQQTANVAIKAKAEFRRHGVGLVVLSKEEAKLAIRPRKNAPLLPWLTESARARFARDELHEK